MRLYCPKVRYRLTTFFYTQKQTHTHTHTPALLTTSPMKSLLLLFSLLFTVTIHSSPSPDNFSTSVVDNGSDCTPVKAQADSTLQDCTPMTSLYFASIGDLCSASCNDRVKSASKDITDKCTLDMDRPRQRAYKYWANHELVKAMCTKVENSHCLELVHDVLMAAQNLQYNLGNKDNNLAAMHCNTECLKDMYNLSSKNGLPFPTLYILGGEMSSTISKALVDYCHY